MTLWNLFIGFLKVGCFAFGGAYGAIPLIRDVVLSYGWMGDDMLAQMIAVSESTPGPIMVNLATYVGSQQAGLMGASIATLAVVLPSFLIILLVMQLLGNALKNRYVQAVLRGVKPCIIGIILATGVTFTATRLFPQHTADWRAILLAVVLLAVMALYKRLKKKKFSPIALIVLSALLGVVLY